MTRAHFVLVFLTFISISASTEKSDEDVADPDTWSIPPGYTEPSSGHSSYRVYNEAKKWANARDKCEEDGAQLAVINSRAEAIYVRNLLANSRPFVGSAYPGAWIGFRDVNSQKKWRTVDDETLDEAGYTHWWPKSFRGAGMCGTIKTCGRLDAVDCNDSVIILCEYNGPYTIKKNKSYSD